MKQQYDIHCHIFNQQVLKRRVIDVILPLVGFLDTTDDDAFSSENINAVLDRIQTFFDAIYQPESEDVFNTLNKVYDGKFITTPLMLDLTYADDNDGNFFQRIGYELRKGAILELVDDAVELLEKKVTQNDRQSIMARIKGTGKNEPGILERIQNFTGEIFSDDSYLDQIEDLEKLTAKHGNLIKPFFGVDPRRYRKENTDMKKKVMEKALGKNSAFVGVKLYAPTGFSPTDPVLYGKQDDFDGIYKLCEEHHIPITVHCSDSGFACFPRVIRVHGDVNINGKIVNYEGDKYKFDIQFFGPRIGKAIHERATVLNHPRLWRKVLERFPDLKINFAHFGGAGQIMEFVQYQLPKELHKLKSREYNDLMETLDAETARMFKNAFTKQGRNYLYKNNLLPKEKARLWLALYDLQVIDNWSKAIWDIVRDVRFKNAMTDLSCFSTGDTVNNVYTIKHKLATFKANFFDQINAYEKSKFMYGSDFFLVLLFGPSMSQYLSDFKQVFASEWELIASENPERFLTR